MSRTGIFCIFLAFSVQPKAALPGYVCVTDYWNTFSCSLKLPITSARNISYCLEAHKINNHENNTYRCQLQRVHEDHICSLRVQDLTDVDKYSMTLIHSENGTKNSSFLGIFQPVKNIKAKTPYNMTKRYANGTYHFSWNSGYEDHKYREALPIKYEFKYYKDGNPTSYEAVSVYNKEETEINEKRLDLNSKYTAMVRSTVHKIKRYNGTWSDWSGTVTWKTGHAEDESSQVSKIAIGMFVLLGLLVLLMSIPAARFKIKEISWVPTPATYFQPLYQNHQGNFQCWVLAKSPIQDLQFMEDFSKIDKISEVLYTLQDQVDKASMYPTAQCHTPYVGPTAEVWAPCQMPDMCIETSIPCEEFSLFCEELPDRVDNIFQSLNLTCLGEDVLSLKDSTLSLECFEDCEASEAPVIINPVPACFKQDYCTLTNSPTGPIPTFTRHVDQDDNTSNDQMQVDITPQTSEDM